MSCAGFRAVSTRFHSLVTTVFPPGPDGETANPIPAIHQFLTNFRQTAGMSETVSFLLGLALKGGAVLLVMNEIRGLILAAPVLYAMYEAGGTWMAIWVGLCSLGGIALSVLVPLFAARKLLRRVPASA